MIFYILERFLVLLNTFAHIHFIAAENLQRIKFPYDSKLHTVDKNAFSNFKISHIKKYIILITSLLFIKLNIKII